MRKLLLLLGLCAMQTPQAQDLHKNVAYADNHVRFTVISDGAVRMEYAPDGQFVDTKSFVAVQRAYPAADYRVKRGAWIEIATPKMVLRYRKNSGPFTASNLSVCSPKGAAVPFVWKPGMQQKGNLKGTYRTLDGYDGDTYVYDERRPKMPIEDGLLATDGWTLIDDSDNFLFDGDKEWEWVEKRPDGDRGGWTGWSWNRTLFPDPAKFLRWLDGEGIRSTFNLHPADGVRCGEDSYADVARDMGIDPASKQTVPWVSSDKKFIRSIFRRILTPMERDGVDFWWLDWQQQPTDPAVEGLSNTWWLNYVFFSDMEKNRDVRPMLYHRWGGLGNHRYQIGFSGDASITWASLDFQPYFNSTASNVLYGYWSHDIGGHHMADRIDPELYIRWMQFGALSPVMRTHSAKSAGLKKEVWNFAPEHADILRSTIRQRYALAPYIYTMARKAYDEGISLCRPMYYEWPEASEAYAFRNQYLFGDDILVAPVTAPGKEGYATVKVWLPEGKWYEWQTGTMLDGGRTVERTFALDEYPVYVRAGAILPMYGDTVKNLNANDEEILLTLFPGGSGEFSLYEDNGDDKRYAAEFARTHLKSVRDGNLLTVTVGKRTGAYRGMPAERKFSVKVLASAAPVSVTVDGAKADWTYLGEEFALVVEIPRTDCAAEKVVCIRYEDAEVDFNGVPAAARRMARALEEFKYHAARKPWEQSWRYTYTDEFGPMGSIAEAVEYAPERIPQLIGEFRKAYDDLPGVLRRQGLSQEESEWFLNQIAYNR